MIVETHEFCNRIRDAVSLGQGLVPLLGAGLSATAGIPTRPELNLYLQRCLAMALGLDSLNAASWKPWRPGINGWPTIGGDWKEIARNGKSLLQKIAVQPNVDSDEKQARFQELCQEAYGCLADWRLALQFLSRLKVATGDATVNSSSRWPRRWHEQLVRHAQRAFTVTMGDVDQHIIDSFFKHIVTGKNASIGHRMAVNLAEVVPMRVLLTLNFDDLLEQAFHSAGVNLTVFEVHQEAGIPETTLLGNDLTLIKMHGGRYGLRADFSLDKAPTEKDRRTFLGYLVGNHPEADWTTHKEPSMTAKYHLLVAGVSGQDRRVRMFIRDALEKIPDLQVFWCCYSAQDLRDVTQHFGPDSQRVIGVRHAHLGLLFWEIYQSITCCLPPRGVEFPTGWRMPTPPSLWKDEQRDLTPIFKGPVQSTSRWFRSAKSKPGIVIEPTDTKVTRNEPSRPATGTTALGWHLFSEWNGPCRCIWLDCEEIGDDLQFKECVLEAISYSLGMDRKKPAIDDRSRLLDDGLLLNEVRELIQISARRWVLFVNLRGSAGYCADSFSRLDLPARPKSADTKKWIQARCTNWEWKSKERERVTAFLNQLAEASMGELRLVILRDPGQFTGLQHEYFGKPIRLKPLDKKEYESWAAERARKAIAWAKQGRTPTSIRQRAGFLRALTLFQQVRHRTALASRAVLQPAGMPSPLEKAWFQVGEWIEELSKFKLVRYKVGGFLWIHWEIREHLRDLLVTDPDLVKQLPVERLAAIHLGLADWYITFFHATSDPRAVFQAVYHRCWVAKLCFQRAHYPRALVMARGALCEACNHLEISRAQILAQGYHHETRECLRDYIEFLIALSRHAWNGRLSGGHVREDATARNLRFLQMVKVKAQLYAVAFERDTGNSDAVRVGCEKLETWLNSWKEKKIAPRRPSLYDTYLNTWGDEALWNVYFLKIEQAILGISLRDYESALRRLADIADELDFPLQEILCCCGHEKIFQLVDNWVDVSGSVKSAVSDKRFSTRRIMFHVLRRYMETLLLQSELTHVLGRIGLPVPIDRKSTLSGAENLYLAAQMLPRYVTVQENSAMRIEHSRLHSVMAGVLALRGDYKGVIRQINEAKVELASVPESEDAIARSVLDLRLIYCSLAKLRGCLSINDSFDEWKKNVATAKQLQDILEAEGLIREVDALTARVEGRMVSFRKSLWWWTTMCRYQVISALFKLRIAHWRNINHGSNNDETRHALQGVYDNTLGILNDVCLRATSDVFQFARVIESFGQVQKLAKSLELRTRSGQVKPAERLVAIQRRHRQVCAKAGLQVPTWLNDFVQHVLAQA